MKELFVPFNLARLAEKKGFNQECLASYKTSLNTNDIELLMINMKGRIGIPEDFYVPAPLYQQLIDWFREKYDLHLELEYIDQLALFNGKITDILVNTEMVDTREFVDTYQLDYYSALEKLITEAFKLI